MERIDHRLAVSAAAKARSEPFVGGPIEVVPNGVAIPPHADPGGRRRTVVFVGRNDRRKGLEVLLRAWPDVARDTGARLRVVGADPLSVRWLMRRQRLSDKGVDLLGSISEAALTDELLAASALVAPSLGGESFGMVLTRAFACATPAVASDIDGYRDVASAETSILVPPGDPAELARAITGLFRDERRRRALGEAARALAVERYAWDGIVDRLVEIYRHLTRAPALVRAAAR
jgi:phosphatidylinositol alpha-mannosyltransferase